MIKDNFLDWLNFPLDSNDPFPAIVRLNYSLNGKFSNLELTKTNYPYLYWWSQENKSLLSLPALQKANFLIDELLNKTFQSLHCFNNIQFKHLHYYFLSLNSLPYDVVNNSQERDTYMAWLLTYGPQANYNISNDETLFFKKNINESKYITYGAYFFTLFHPHFVQFKDLSNLKNILALNLNYYEPGMMSNTFISLEEVQSLSILPPIENSNARNHLEELMSLKNIPIKKNTPENIFAFLEHLNFNKKKEKTQTSSPSRHEAGIKYELGVNILGYPQSEMGLGEDARTTLRALRKNDILTCALSIESKDQQHPKKINEIKNYISDFPKYKINIVNSPITTAAFEVYKNKKLSQFQDFYNIAYAPWELEFWSQELHPCIKFYNEIWAPSRFIEKAFQNKFNIPVHHMPLAVTLIDFIKRPREYFGLPNNKYIYLTMFDFNSSLNRKNPFDSVRAFKLAFPDNQDVIFAIKVMYTKDTTEWNDFLSLIDNDPRIIIINKILTREDVLALLDSCDAFISLHRSEGFGRCLAEAMLLKKPVIATNYSGNIDFCTNEYSFPVDYNLIEVQSNEYIYVHGQRWASPIIESAIKQIREVFYNRELVERVTSLALKNIKENFSEEACGERYAQRIKEIKKDVLDECL